MDYTCELYNSVMQINSKEWQALIPDTDLAMNQDLIFLIEKTLHDQAQFWTVAIRNKQHQLVACACLNLFQTDILQSAPLMLQKIAGVIRTKHPKAFKKNVLFCGLAVPSGHTHIRISPSVDTKLILKLIAEQMYQLAKQVQAQLIVFKEFSPEQFDQVESLQELGFYRGELAPIFQLTHSFKDIKDYQSALRSRYRLQMKNNLKKFNSNFKVEHIFDANKISERITPEIYQLYLNVWGKAKEKLECLSIDFFQLLPRSLPNQTVLTLISHDGHPVAFSMGLITEKAYYSIYVGLDYSYNAENDLYFNLFYHELDLAFSINKPEIYLGQTSERFKSRLGAIAEGRFFLMKPVTSSMQLIFKYFHKLIFPKMPELPVNNVFARKPVPSEKEKVFP